MTSYTGKDLAGRLRALCDSARQRLWIASPYIGTWDGVRCIIGRTWWGRLSQNAVHVLTDAEQGSINPKTIAILQAKGPVKHLRGLHAKLYIIDDEVILTSANLTRTAFSSRYEIGIHLTGTRAKHVIATYQCWWDNLAQPITRAQLESAKKNRALAGEDTSSGLPQLNKLPPDPGDLTFDQAFEDYEPFCAQYRALAAIYKQLPRAWPNSTPLYLEIDSFLNYLFHEHPKTPSHPYTHKLPRHLTPAQQAKDIKKYAQAFRQWAQGNSKDAQERLDRARQLQTLLTRQRIPHLSRHEVHAVLGALHCMQDARVRNRVLQYNTIRNITKAWAYLLHGTAPVPERMSSCAGTLFGFKRSGVQELLGWFRPNDFPIRNANTNAGMRFLGYDVSAS